jgi:hypothetical protein
MLDRNPKNRPTAFKVLFKLQQLNFGASFAPDSFFMKEPSTKPVPIAEMTFEGLEVAEATRKKLEACDNFEDLDSVVKLFNKDGYMIYDCARDGESCLCDDDTHINLVTSDRMGKLSCGCEK